MHTFCFSFLSMSEKLLSVLPRMYKKYMCNSPSGGELHLERWSIPMIGPKLPPLTLKIVEHSRYLPVCGILLVNWAKQEGYRYSLRSDTPSTRLPERVVSCAL